MNKDARNVIKYPVISEKSVQQTAINKYTFCVADWANKIEVKNAVEEIFKGSKVKVRDVNISFSRGKERRVGRRVGRTADWKRAVVTLESGKIELGGINYFEQ